jgi:hypothetical protein
MSFLEQAHASREPVGKHRDLLLTLGVDGNSSDESDPEDASSYRRISPDWRSKELAHFLHRLDDVILRIENAPRIGSRRRPGNPPQRRNHSELVHVGATAPQQLPRNCYYREWLETLRPWEECLLQLEDRYYDFSADLYLAEDAMADLQSGASIA